MIRHEVQILRAVGMAQTALAAKTETSVRSVWRIEREVPVATGDTAALIEARKVGRPSTAASRASQVERLRPRPLAPLVRFEGVPGGV